MGVSESGDGGSQLQELSQVRLHPLVLISGVNMCVFLGYLGYLNCKHLFDVRLKLLMPMLLPVKIMVTSLWMVNKAKIHWQM